MSLRGQCIICYSAFTPTTVFALPCGHTFHEQCIGRWLETPGRGCPNCRRKCRAKDVTRIFFDIGGLNDTFNVTTRESREDALRAKNEDLQARLDRVTAEASKAKKDLSMQNGQLETLKTLVANEKKVARKATQKLQLEEAEVLQIRSRLKSMLLSVNEANSKNQVLIQQLEASELALAAEKKKCQKMAEELKVKNKRVSGFEIGVTQGHLHCMCARGTCATNRCTCRKNNLPCNSRCHPSKSCANSSGSDRGDQALTRSGRSSLPCTSKNPVQPISEDRALARSGRSSLPCTSKHPALVQPKVKL